MMSVSLFESEEFSPWNHRPVNPFLPFPVWALQNLCRLTANCQTSSFLLYWQRFPSTFTVQESHASRRTEPATFRPGPGNFGPESLSDDRAGYQHVPGRKRKSPAH